MIPGCFATIRHQQAKRRHRLCGRECSSSSALASAVIPLVGAAQGKPDRKRHRTAPEEPPKVFRIVELGEEKSLKWSDVQTPDVRIPLTVVNDGKTRAVGGLSPQPRSWGPRLLLPCSSMASRHHFRFRLAAKKSVGITLSATLRAAATYRSMIEISAAGRQTTVFHCRDGAEASGAAHRRARNGGKVYRGGALVGDWEFSRLRDHGDRDRRPAIRGTALPSGCHRIRPKADGSVKSAAPEVTLTATKLENVTTTVVPGNVKFTLAGITQAGRYDATVRLRGDGYQGKDVAVTVYAREPGWLAVAPDCVWIAGVDRTSHVCQLHAPAATERTARVHACSPNCNRRAWRRAVTKSRSASCSNFGAI